MKKLLLSALAVLAVGTAQAQFRYTFSTQTGQTYTPLTAGTDLTGGQVWDDDDFSAPLGFSFVLNGDTTTTFNLVMNGTTPFIASTNNFTDSLNAFLPLESDLIDRGYFDTTTAVPVGRSPIRYLVTGTAPSRVFKAELFNVGFFDDTTNADSINLQVWMYEDSSILELRYGSSLLSAGNVPFYFGGNPGPVVGLVNNVDLTTGAGYIYHLAGATAAPALDSFLATSGPSTSLNNYPLSGTVYRFKPKPTSSTGGGGGGTSISEAVAAARALKLYPTQATAAITVEWGGADGEAYEIISAGGQQVRAGRLQRGTQSIGVSDLATGAYYLRLAAGAHLFMKR